MLRAQGIDTLMLMGHATSGVILSTVGYGADADYRLIVVEDGCAGRDAGVRQPFLRKVFPRQAALACSQEVVRSLGYANWYRGSQEGFGDGERRLSLHRLHS